MITKTDARPRLVPRECMSQSDVEQHIHALARPQIERLVLFARTFSLGSRLSPEDVLHTAIVSALDGTKPCPKGVDFVAYLKMSMRNVVWNARKKAKRLTLVPVGGDQSGEGDSITGLNDNGLSPEEEAALSDIKVSAYELLSDDEEAQLVFICRMEDKDVVEICKELSLEKKECEAILRRIDRKLVRLTNTRNV